MGKKVKNPKLTKAEELARLEKEETERLERLAEERKDRLQLICNEIRENNLRRAILDDSIKIFGDLLKNVRNFKKSIHTENLWKNYLKCNPIPDTEIPAAIRELIYRFSKEFENFKTNNLNWWVKCDEKSLLTQNINVPNTTRSFVKQHREPTGKFYDQKLRLMMKVYESLEETLRRQKVSKNRLNDLITLRDEMRETVFKFLDAHTLEIIMNIDREMDSMTPLIAHYSYAAPDYIKFIWSFKDVALPENRMKLNKITMKPLKMIVTISSELDLESTCVRALWFKRDLFSDYCHSFLPLHNMEFQSLSTTIEREMIVKKHMRKIRLNEMREARVKYDQMIEEQRLLQEEEEKKKKNKKKGEKNEQVKKQKKIKVLVEPPIVDESTYVNVDDEYEEYEKNKANDERESLSPVLLNLKDHDVNMREFQILGGIYKIECVERPQQTKQIEDRMFIRMNENPNILKYKNFTHVYQEPKLSRIKDERMSIYFADKIFLAQSKALGALTKVEISFSPKIIWFEPPIVCRWENWEESEEFLQLDPKMQDYNLNYKKYIEREQEKLFNLSKINHYSSKRTFNDFQLSSSQSTIKLSFLIKHYLIPIMPQEFLHYHEKLELFEMKQRAWHVYKEQEAMRSATSGHEEMKKASVEAISMLDDFLKYFEMKYDKPRNLFPKIVEGKLSVEEDKNLLERVREARSEIRKALKLEDFYDSRIEYPLKDEPITLSELLERIQNIQYKMIPIFKEIRNESIKDEKIKKSAKKSNKKFGIKNRKAKTSLLKSNAAKKSISASNNFRKSSTSTAENSREESSTIKSSSTNEDDDASKLILIPHSKGKWTTKDIYELNFDGETKTLSFYTGKYGIFAFPVKKYVHFPFKSWECYPIIRSSDEKMIVMKIETRHCTLEFKITNQGFTFNILKPGRMPVQEITKPIRFFKLKTLLTSLNINIFPEIDACHYIEDITEKHHAMEFHTYKSMANLGLLLHYKSNKLNSVVDRRMAIINYKSIEKKEFKKILITPLRVLSIVENEEKRGVVGNLTERLPFKIDPLEQEFYPDILTFMKADIDRTQQRQNQKHFMIVWHMQALLQNLRLLSFSK